MVKKKTEKQLTAELKRPYFKGLTAQQLRYVATSPNKKRSLGAKSELRKRKLKIKGKTFGV